MKGIFLKNWIVLWGGLKFNLVIMTIVGLMFSVIGQINMFGSFFFRGVTLLDGYGYYGV